MNIEGVRFNDASNVIRQVKERCIYACILVGIFVILKYMRIVSARRARKKVKCEVRTR